MSIPEITFGHSLLTSRTLYVSDLDGTLLNSHSIVSDASARMLNTAIASGAHFTVATARTPATAIHLLSEIDMRLPGAVMTGAALFDFSSSRFSRLQYLPAGEADRLIRLYREAGVGTVIYTFTGDRLEVYHTGELNQHEKTFLSERCHSAVKHFNVPADGESILPPSLDNTLLLYGVQPWSKAESLYRRIKEDKYAVTPLCYHDSLGDEWGELEMFGPYTSKASAIESVASDMGAGRIVAFGDNINDLPIFRMADCAVAVGNARAEAIEEADEVIGTNDEDAVASFILKHIR